MIVPFPPGGANDIVARLVSYQLNERWGRPVVIDNRGGAGGNIGTEIGVRAAPDGYTLIVGSVSTLASNVGLYPKLAFDPRRDLAPITLFATVPSILVVNPSVAAATVQELIQLAKATPKRLNFSSFGDGSSAHLMGELFKSMAKVDIVHIPYKGGGPALVAVIAGEVQMTFSNLSVAFPQVKAGKVKPIAVTSAKRAIALPETPTIAESGLPDFQASTWVGIAAPLGTPRALIQRINRDIHSVIAEPEMKNQFLSRGLEPAPSTPEEFARLIRTDIERWSKLIREVGVRVE
jgi:tripartite-type tricarboxylate transporter receptor subunit TctC